jgi:hypothetical protein
VIEAIVDHILQRRGVSRAAQIAWAAFLVLGPLAYVGGSMLEYRTTARDVARVMVDRDGARATAQAFAARHGVDASTWTGYISTEPTADLIEYFVRRRDTAAARARTFSAPITIHTILAASDGQRALVTLDQDGHVDGFDFTHVNPLVASEAAPLDRASAAALASVREIPNLTSVLSLGEPRVETLEKMGKGCRNFTWHARTPALPGLSYDIASAVCGVTPVRQSVRAAVDTAYAIARWRPAVRPVKILEGIYALYMTIVVIYSLIRYSRRTMEREISHARTLMLAGLIGAAMSVSFVCGIDIYVYTMVSVGQGLVWYPVAASFIVFLIVGLGVAVGYGAGEGDLRELYPGKMTSLDALLRGKIFSRNVARSTLFGTALAAWIMFTAALLDWVFHLYAGGAMAELVKLPLFRAPLVAVFTSQVLFVSVIPASGLLLPLAFLGRRVHRPVLRNVLMIMLAVFGCLATVTKYGEIETALVAVTALTAILLGAFFGMDLLAAVFGLGAFLVANSMARFIAISPSWLQMGAAVGIIGICFIGMELWAALHGVEYLEDEVRPAYAGNIVARQQMQAEMAAAREAQLHLLPKVAPSVHGLDITAACLPARIVGGDFYDFFSLGEARLGIFIAEGGNRGIGAALTIALAKGFLMHTVRRNLSPGEVIQRLESTLGPLLEGSGAVVATHVAYAVLDTAAGTIRYARTGEYPRVLVGGELVAEHSTKMADTGTTLYEGNATLRTGQTVLLFTDGIARRVRIAGPTAAQSILKVLAKKRRGHELEDDLTAVVIKVTRADSAMEVVA